MNNLTKTIRPSAEQYRQAMLSLRENGKINEKIMEMLKFHYFSKNHTVTFTQLACAANYANYGNANIDYGKFGHKLGDAIDMEFSPSKVRNGEPFYCSAIGIAIERRGNEEFKLKMHQEVVEALNQLGWFGSTDVSIDGNENSTEAQNPTAPPDEPPESDDEECWAQIKTRRGQPKFREMLLNAYECKCAITGTAIVDLLEAAHIIPHAEGANYRTRNGLLLRADIHTLFDLKLLSIDQYMRVHLSKALRNTTEYGYLHGKKINLPASSEACPDHTALERRHNRFLDAEKNRS